MSTFTGLPQNARALEQEQREQESERMQNEIQRERVNRFASSMASYRERVRNDIGSRQPTLGERIQSIRLPQVQMPRISLPRISRPGAERRNNRVEIAITE